MRPWKWDDSQVGFRGSNASGGRIVLLPSAFWAHDASKMAISAHLFYSVFYSVSSRSCFLGSGFGQQLFNFRSPAVH